MTKTGDSCFMLGICAGHDAGRAGWIGKGSTVALEAAVTGRLHRASLATDASPL